MSSDRERVISVPLSEAEWKAFVARHPEPVVWLREQILSQVATDAPQTQETKSAA